MELVARLDGVVGRHPGAVGRARPELLDRGVPQVPVPLAAGREHPGVRAVPQPLGHQGQRRVRRRVLEGRRGGVPAVVVAALVRTVLARLQPAGYVAALLVIGDARTPVVGGVVRRRTRGVLLQERVRLLLVAREQALGPGVDQERSHRVAGHDVGLAVGERPARQPAAVPPDRDDRQRDVAGDLRLQDLEQLVLRPVGVPQRQVLVRREPGRGVGPAVEARVPAVDVPGEVRVQVRVVQGRVEGALPLGRTAADPDGGQLPLPTRLQRRARGVEVVGVLRLRLEVLPRAFDSGVGESHLDDDVAVGLRVEGHPGAVAALAGGVPLTGGGGVAAPGAVLGEGPVEGRGEVDGVPVLARAEVARLDPALDRPVADDVHLRVVHPLVGLARVEQDVGPVGGGEGVALPARAGGRGQLGVDVVRLQPDAVVTRFGLLVVMRVGGAVVVGVDALDGSGRRHERQFAHHGAADAGEMGLAESVDPVLLVVVASLAAGVRADLDHAEGSARAGEGVAEVLRADERVHQRGEFGSGRGSLGDGRHRGQRAAGHDQGGEEGRRAVAPSMEGSVHGGGLLFLTRHALCG